MSDRRRMSLGEYRLALFCLFVHAISGRALDAQLMPLAPSPTGIGQKSYADYYRESVQNYSRPPNSVRDYTIDRYYYHDPNLSPYLNLTRLHGRDSLNNYYRYVLPEVQRRSSYAAPSPSGPSTLLSPQSTYPMTGPIHTPVAPPSAFHDNLPYFNNYYNNFGGLKR